jgi:ubiquinone/menaquinone biosynthesis C-methylase UbiE
MDWAAQGGSAPERYQSVLVPAMFAPFAERLVGAAGVGPGARVLDVACGTGAVARAAARRAGAEGRIVGVDLGPPMLAIARAQPVDSGAAPIEYIEGTADALPVGAFDVVTCQQGLQFFADRIAALHAMRAALDSGGRVAVATWCESSEGWAPLAAALERHISPEAGAMMRSPFALADPDELRRLLEEAGFAEVEVSQQTLTTRYAARTDWARAVLLAGPVAPAFVAAPQEKQNRVVADVAEALRDYAGGEDELHFPMTTNVALARA